MDKIKKYVERFMKAHNRNERYGLYVKDIVRIKNVVLEKPFETICLTFDYGFAKGYRSALAEMKEKGGVV